MKHFTLTEMKRENDYLREHPEEMKKELYFMGLVMPLVDQTPTDAMRSRFPPVAATRTARTTRKPASSPY